MEKSAAPLPLSWFNISFIAGVHAFALLGPFAFSGRALGAAIFLWWLTGSLGIGLGFHRLLTHQGFSAPLWLRRFLALCGTLAVQGGPIAWVGGHRLHHAHSDRDLDPHNSRRGFWHAHVGWLLRRDPRYGQFANYSKYAKDLANDRFMLFLDRWYVPMQFALGIGLFAWGGWACTVWGIFVRLVFGWHCTWLVNSAAHMFGYQSHEARDGSRNCWWVALLSFGEGWHNNHHAFPRSARHGLRWWEFDLNYWSIRLLEAVRLVRDVRTSDHLRTPRVAYPAARVA